MKNKLVSLLMTAALIVLLTAVNAYCGQPPIKIGITQIATNPGIDAIRDGFLSQMKKMGYEENVNVKYIQTNAQGDNSAAQSIAKSFVNEKVDLIFSITTPSSQMCAQAIKGTTIPLIFGAVTDPVAAGLVKSLDKPEFNITGTSDKWPIEAQFDLLLRLVPGVKTVGIIHNPGETNSESNMKEVEAVCAKKNLKTVRVAVSNTSEVYSAAGSLVGRCDAIYVPADNTVISAMESVVKVSEKNKIPLLPGVSSGVATGGFGTIGPDYFDIGVESAKLADMVIKGKNAGDIPVATAKKYELFFNIKSAKLTGVTIPDELLEKAAKVYGDIEPAKAATKKSRRKYKKADEKKD
ncbi:ABC transporter substrate-binding protein [Candidatus Magnetominusculus dajiuhuensis]|uniref:ABC transporter substrate-binding protein n=1 Tax=Candidatus Magnetominusculus dajiuhuensis TaxID=3137712 RepID=UPI003B43CA5B